MEKENTFGEFIKKHSFVIPDYQRAYAWTEKQLNPFLNDILEHVDVDDNHANDTNYYLGHYILEGNENDVTVEIVDGQQRITTVYLFLLVCGYFIDKNFVETINFAPVSYDMNGLKEIEKILKSKNKVEEQLGNLIKSTKTSSLTRMINAIILFKNAFEVVNLNSNSTLLQINEIDKYITVLDNAYCSASTFTDKAVAAQIFELHNTRGVKLTETEKVKALLMKVVFINSEQRDNDIRDIQENFAEVFEYEENVSDTWLRGNMHLDSILMYHLRSVEDGFKNDHFGLPQSVEGDNGSFEHVKKALKNKIEKSEIVAYAKNLAEEFAVSMKILAVNIPNSDKNNRLIGDVLLLDKNKSLIFLLRAFRVDENISSILISRWENFLLNYEMIYWHGFFHNKRYRGNWHEIYKSLLADTDFIATNAILKEFYDGRWFGSDWKPLAVESKTRFEAGQKYYQNNAYNFPKVGYFLYKYEISKKANIELIRNSIFKNDKVSIDHIVAQQISSQSLGFENINTLEESDPIRIQANLLINDINNVSNGIGNLALSTTSRNASDSNKLPLEHVNTYWECGFIATAQDVTEWTEPKYFVDKIRERTDKIVKFILENVIEKSDIWN